MHKPVNFQSPANSPHIDARAYHSDPGGSRTHDLRIKSSLAASDNDATHSMVAPHATRPIARNAPERIPTSVRSASLAEHPHKGVSRTSEDVKQKSSSSSSPFIGLQSKGQQQVSKANSGGGLCGVRENEELTQELITAYMEEAEGNVGRAIHLLTIQLRALGGIRFQAMSDARDILWRRNASEQGS